MKGKLLPRTTRLKVGQTIPALWTRDVRGQAIDSAGFTSDYTLLVFLRHAGCPFCNLALHRLVRQYKTLQAHDCEVVAFVQSTPSKIERDVYERHEVSPRFSIVADKEQDFYKLFKVHSSMNAANRYTFKYRAQWLESVRGKGYKQADFDGNSIIVPALFLVNKTGRLLLVDYAADLYDDAAFDPIYKLLKPTIDTS